MRRIARAKTVKTGRRGWRRQRTSRAADRTVWRSAVRVARWLSRRGVGEKASSRRIGLSPRTVRRWEERWRTEQLAPRARGRPVERPDPGLRNAILSLFGEVGPEITEAQLSEYFPEVSRAELRELKRRYRAAWRRGDVTYVYALRWSSAGSVWAIDHTHPPIPVDGIFPRILVVRDLASGKQLAALPVEGEDAKETVDLLRALIRQHGAPLVLKSDNGSAFKAGKTREFLEERGILPLYSPPRFPQYNGAVESGIGSLKTHAHRESARHDRPGEWTCDDVEAARLRGNELGRPHGLDRPTPDEVWADRMVVSEGERAHVRKLVDQERRKEKSRRGILPLIGPTPTQRDAIDRSAISSVLNRCGYLHIRRRRITPPISQRKAARIT
jgi:transposase InsO family protein